jgi:phosphoglycerate dehydrogenase-like enzyme
LAEAEVWVTPTRPPYLIDEEMLCHAPRLRVVATPSTGTNHIVLEDLAKRNLQLVSIKKSPVIERIFASSEFSFALLLALIKNIPLAVARAQAGQWVDRAGHWTDYEGELRNVEVDGMTMGLMGFGRIGRKMARYGHGMGMKVIATDPHREVDFDYVESVSLPELLARADFFCIHIHLDETTRGIIDDKVMSQLKPGAYLLNTSRGEVLDEDALLRHLKSSHIQAAALDVISGEHLADKRRHPLIAFARKHPKKLIISPHIGGCSIHSESKSARDILDQIQSLQLGH